MILEEKVIIAFRIGNYKVNRVDINLVNAAVRPRSLIFFFK